MKKYNIVQIGSFDVENYGDLLFPVVLEEELKKRISINKLFLFSPIGGEQPFYHTKVFPIKKLEETISKEKIDAIIIGGGDVIRLDKQIVAGYDSTYDTAFGLWLLPILLGHKYRIPVIWNAPGVPFQFSKRQLDFALPIIDTSLYLSVRDECSKELLGEHYKEICHVVPDTVNLISDIYSKQELAKNLKKLQKEKIIPKLDHYIVFQTKIIYQQEELYIHEIKKLLEYITKEEKKKVLIVPIGYVHNDMKFSSKFIDKNNKNIYIVEKKLHPYDMLSVFASSDGFIGTSLHGLVTSHTYNVPILAINTENLVKVKGFLKLINKEKNEINQIEDCLETYRKEFKHQDFSVNDSIKEKITEHFDIIANMIKEGLEDTITNSLENNLLNQFYLLLEQYEQNSIENKILKEENNRLNSTVISLTQSKSFKITYPLRKIRSIFTPKEKVTEKEITSLSTKLEKTRSKIAIQIHIFYPDLLEEIYHQLLQIPYPFDLYISTDTKDKKQKIFNFFTKKEFPYSLIVEIFENRGRDIYPFIEQLRNRIRKYDYLCHLHTKKSQYAVYGKLWRRYLYHNLLGSKENIKSIFYEFKKDKSLGIVFPITYEKIANSMQIGNNQRELDNLCQRLHITNPFSNVFPAGSMFWARVDAIRPLFEIVTKEDFAKEDGQKDGTYAHAIERIFVILAQSRGYTYLQTINKTEENQK